MIKFRYYMDNQKEQEWLNNLSRKGWGLKNFFLGFYKFEKCEPGEYEYQIDLMPEGINRREYYSFMEDTGIEVVCRWYYWVYLRKRTSVQGEFKLYSDNESLRAHYASVVKFFKPLMYLELIASLLQIPGVLSGYKASMVTFVLLLTLFIALKVIITRYEERIKLLNK